ncbi:MAG TPA: hypothetical protein VN436_12430, partial [Holophaga sp.]|nr:hypothetical protein [Holophaga sp.]
GKGNGSPSMSLYCPMFIGQGTQIRAKDRGLLAYAAAPSACGVSNPASMFALSYIGRQATIFAPQVAHV